MTVLRQPLINAFRSWFDLNGPLLGPASICSSASDHISRNASKPSMRDLERIRQRPSLGVTKNRRLTSTWRRLLHSSLRFSTPLPCSRIPSRSSIWDRAKDARCLLRRSSRSRRLSASNSHRICTASQQRISSDTALHPSSARHSSCIA